MEKKISQEELEERIAIIKRFKKLLIEQRSKFEEYLLVLEKQSDKIEENDGDSVMAHAELESQIVRNIAELQKVIVPMQGMYDAVVPEADEKERESLESLQSDLENIQKQVLIQNEHNRNLLKIHLEDLKKQIHAVRISNPYRNRTSVYAEKAAVGSLVSIEG